MTTGDLARVNVMYTDTQRTLTFENVFGFIAKGGSATLSNLGSAFQTALIKNTSGGLLYAMVPVVTCDQLIVRDVNPGTAAEVELDFTAVAGGIVGGDPLPPQSAGVITWRTGFAGRSFRGRTYLPGVSESDSTDGTLSSGYLTRLGTIITQMLAVFGPSGSDTNWQFAVISEVSAGAPRVPPIGTAVTAGVQRPFVQTQRRRAN
jgi:hypothetical protein